MIAQTHDKSRLKSEEVGCGSLSQQAVVTPKNPIKILKGLNKYNHIILLAKYGNLIKSVKNRFGQQPVDY